MKSPVLKALALALVFAACGSEQEPKKTAETEKVYIPVTDYLRGEIKNIDSISAGILKRTWYGVAGDSPMVRSDSMFIQPDEFKELAQPFLPDILSHGQFEKSFTENSFMDQTTHSLSFTYQSIDTASPVKRVDVLIEPSLDLDKIKSIFMEKAFLKGDTLVEQKMYWKPHRSFEITTLKTINGSSPDQRRVKVIWDPFSYDK